MNFSRRKFLHLAAGSAALPMMPPCSWAQAYPTRPVRIIVGYPPGGANDTVARLLAQWLTSENSGSHSSSKAGRAQETTLRRKPSYGRPLMAIRCCWRIQECDQCDTLRQAQFQLHSRHRTGREHHGCAARP